MISKNIPKIELTIFWLRRDLRLNDNHGLHEALRSGLPVLPIFIFDTNILDSLKDKKDKRVNLFIVNFKVFKKNFYKKILPYIFYMANH